MSKPTVDEVKKAVKAKKIDVPVMRVDKRGRTLTLYLYGGGVVKYTLPSSKNG